MSAYRTNVKGSWTYMMQHSEQSEAKLKDFYKNMILMLMAIDEYTGQKYSATIKDKISEYEFNSLALNGDIKGMKHSYYYHSKLGVKGKIALHIQDYLPLMYPVISKVYRVLIGDPISTICRVLHQGLRDG
jgi:hypothetical protein